MRVLIYAPNYLPATRYGGPIRSSHGLAHGLVQLGHKVTVVTTNVDGEHTIRGSDLGPSEIDGVIVNYFPIQPPKRLYRSREMIEFVRREIHNFDVVYINGLFLLPGPRIAAIARRAGVPYVVAPRGMLVPELVAKRSPFLKRLWIFAFERSNLRNAARVHATAKIEASDVSRMRLGTAPIEVIENGVSLPTKLPSEKDVEELWRAVPKGKRVAFLARLDWKKGADLAIDVLQQLEGACLYLAGQDQIGLQKKLEQKAEKLGLGDRISFLGGLEGDRKWAFLRGADVLIVPSIHENFGITVVEALGMETPVLCSQNIGASEVVREVNSGWVVERSVNSFAEALRQMLRDRQRCKSNAVDGREYVLSQLGWPAISIRVSNMFEAIIAERK